MNIFVIIFTLLVFACEKSTLKGGGDEVSDVIGCLFLRVPLNFLNLLMN